MARTKESPDFNQLMNELLELEKVHPGNPEIQGLKRKVQKELDRQNQASGKEAGSSSSLSATEVQNIHSVLDSLYTKAEAEQKKSSSRSGSKRHHSSSRHHSSRSSSRHRHSRRVVTADPSALSMDDLDFEDLLYDEKKSPQNSVASEIKSKKDEYYSSSALPPESKRPEKASAEKPKGPAHATAKSAERETKPSSAGKALDAIASSMKNRSKSDGSPSKRKNKKTDSGKQKRWSSLRSWQKATAVVLGIILLLVLSGTLTFQQLMNRINRVDPDEVPDLSKEGLEDLLSLSEEELEKLRETDPDAESLIIDKNDRYGVGDITITPMQRDDVLNILLIGQDRRTGDKGQMRSDSMILVTIDKTSKEMKLTSLMRDMYVPVPGYGYGMINATLLHGGMKLLNATIEQNFGVHIDGDIQIDFYRFIKLMDLVGPITLDLNVDEVKYFKEQNGWSFVKGLNELNSEQVLAYARTRTVGRSDWERTERQRKVIMAIYNKLKKSSIPSLMQFTYNAMPLITTNINKNTDLINIVYTILINRMPITQSNRIPIEGTYTMEIRENTLHVMVPELYPNAKALQKIAFG